jgi:predicted house-cleaning noncanonical NTP pyrophosphatase (MazG superfamily)
MSEKQRTMYEKLVRDGIPRIIRDSGAEPHVRVLSPDEFVPAAIDKIVEEAGELKDAQGDDRLHELADLWEVLSSIVNALGWTMSDVKAAADVKRSARGGFDDRVWLVATRP